MTVAENTREALNFIANKYNFMFMSDMTPLDKANTSRLVSSGIGSFKYDPDMKEKVYVLGDHETSKIT